MEQLAHEVHMQVAEHSTVMYKLNIIYGDSARHGMWQTGATYFCWLSGRIGEVYSKMSYSRV